MEMVREQVWFNSCWEGDSCSGRPAERSGGEVGTTGLVLMAQMRDGDTVASPLSSEQKQWVGLQAGV